MQENSPVENWSNGPMRLRIPKAMHYGILQQSVHLSSPILPCTTHASFISWYSVHWHPYSDNIRECIAGASFRFFFSIGRLPLRSNVSVFQPLVLLRKSYWRRNHCLLSNECALGSKQLHSDYR